MGLIIQPAQKFRQHARVCLWGIEKAGKTHAALELATALAPSGKIGVLSSERGSSATFDRRFPHAIVNLSVDDGYKPVRNPFSAKRYEEGLDLLVYGGYDVIIVDSLSHLWEGEGGILEVVNSRGGEFQKGWEVGSPLYQRLLNHLLNVPCHLIVTLRSKDAYEMEDYTKSNGSMGKRPKNVGSAPVIRKYFGYEMQFMIRMEDMKGQIVSSAYQDELPKDMEIESMTSDFAPALSRFLEGAPMPERIPTLLDSGKRGLVTGAWTKETFYATAGKALGVTVSRDVALEPEQLKQLAALAEAGAPVESQAEPAESPVTTEKPAPSQVAPTPTPAPVPAQPEPITETQLSSIRRLCERLDKSEPEGTNKLNHQQAKELIAQLSQEYKQSRTAASATSLQSTGTPKQRSELADNAKRLLAELETQAS